MVRFSLKAAPKIALGGVLALGLAACEVRQTGEDAGAGDEPVSEETPASDATPLATPEPGETPVASIIREDVAPEPTPDEPPEPLELVLPFPDGANLSPRAERLLQSAMDSGAMAEGWPIVLGGHTDSGGNDQANLRSARARAEAVAAWLIEQGVADERITVIAFGEQNPIAPNANPDGTSNEEGRRANRRVELRIAPQSGSQAAPAGTPSPANTADGNGA